MSNAVIDTWFPTCIYRADDIVSEAQNKTVLDKSLALSETVESGGKGWKCNTYNSRGTYDLFADPDFGFILGEVTSRVNEFAKVYNSSHLYQCSSAWFNVGREHSYQEYHVHPNSVFSAIYYASSPEGSGPVAFEKPELDMFPVKEIESRNTYTYMSCTYAAKERMLLIFRSSLRHMVQVGSNKAPRVSLSFNFL